MTRIIEDVKFDFQDVLLMPKRSGLSSRSEVNLFRDYKFKHSKTEYHGIPIIVANMDHTGTMKMHDAVAPHGLSVALHKFYEPTNLIDFFSFSQGAIYTMGVTDEDYTKFKEVWFGLTETYRPKVVCIDVANGYSHNLARMVGRMREQYHNLVIMAGNVVTGDMVYDLLEKGANIVKVGIGPGSLCTTRRVTGVGYPQLSAIMECADAAHGREKGLICADGGITCPGDIAKAFAAGADFVMCGALFAGHQECEGEILYKSFPEMPAIRLPEKLLPKIEAVDIPYAMKFHGMSSREAMLQHYGEQAGYRAAEGKEVEVPYKGPVENTVREILGGLRSACTYVGATQLKHLPKCATFVKVNRQLNESLGK